MKRLSLHNKTQYIWQNKEWPHFTYNINALTEALSKTRLRQGTLKGRMLSLGFALGEEARAEVLAHEAVQTSAVEGAKLDLASVRSSVARQLGLPWGGLAVRDRSADGIVSVLIDATAHHGKALTVKRLQGWQAALFPTGYSGLHEVRAGKWRSSDPMRVVSGPLGRETVHFEAPPSQGLSREIKEFLSWWVKGSIKEDGLIRAGLAHLYFVTIHPFEDGNGRVARALTEMALAQDEKSPKRFYSLSTQIMEDREEYYDVLERTQKGGLDATEWLQWFLRTVEKAIAQAESISMKVLAKSRFWEAHREMPLSERQRKVLNMLLDAGPDGFLGGLTTRKYVSVTQASRVTAYREITDLLEKKILVSGKGQGRNAYYEINWPV